MEQNKIIFPSDAPALASAASSDTLPIYRSGLKRLTLQGLFDWLFKTNKAAAQASLGMDYSLLTEQVVPGEFWLGRDGVKKKQVYTRTFVFTAPATINESLTLTLGIDSLFDIKVIYNYPITYGSGSNFMNLYEYAISTPGGFVFRNLAADRVTKTFVITIKYTKL